MTEFVASISHSYGILANIPADFHSADLRNYFSQFIESKGFSCFHFKHRPETKEREKDDRLSYEESTSSSGQNSDRSPELERFNSAGSAGLTTGSELGGEGKTKNRPKTFCCVLRLREEKMARFIKMYHKKPWIDKKGSIMSSRCFISRIKVDKSTSSVDSGEEKEYRTRGDSRLIPPEREVFTESHLKNLVELNPPDLMPNGNVGTPTAVFLEYIRTCRLPPRIIQKLGLTFSKTRSNRRYGNVPFAYGGKTVEGVSEEEEVAVTASGQEIRDGEFTSRRVSSRTGEQTSKMGRKKDGKTRRKDEDEDEEEASESDEDDDDDTCEEWERHESLHEDITSQERTKERLFEEEIELKWEKGGSGLVFYTDAAFWDAQEGDFDEKTSDDWDVDMSIYYDEYGGDKDARDSLNMRKMERMKRGLEDTSVFEKGIGQFEKHTKGIGRRVLQKQGWSEGKGLGKTVAGMADALDNTGQHSRDKTGFGYHGEKLQPTRNYVPTAKKQRRADKEVIISTVYDNPSVTDPAEPLMRSRGPYHLKYRHEIEFVKGDRR